MTGEPPVRLRVEVTDLHGTVAMIIDPARLKPRARGQLDALANELVGNVASILGSDDGHARRVLIAELCRLIADDEAYERVAERRGILPL